MRKLLRKLALWALKDDIDTLDISLDQEFHDLNCKIDSLAQYQDSIVNVINILEQDLWTLENDITFLYKATE